MDHSEDRKRPNDLFLKKHDEKFFHNSMSHLLEELRFKAELFDDIKYFSPLGIMTALFTLGASHLKKTVVVHDKWLTDIFADHIPFATIGLLFLAISCTLSAAGIFDQGRIKNGLLHFGIHLTRRLLSYCSVSFGFLSGFFIVVIGHWAVTKSPSSLVTSALMVLFGFFLVCLPLLSATLVSTINLPSTKMHRRTFLLLFALSLLCFFLPLLLPAK